MLRRAAILVLGLGSALGAQQRGAVSTSAADSPCPVVETAVGTQTEPAQRDTSAARDTTQSTPSRAAASDAPAIVLYVAASAREVRFARQPTIRVRLCGAVADSVRVVERRNLPDPVQPGTTYRDVFIAVEILGHLNAECLSRRITGQEPSGVCASLGVRDTTNATRPPR